MSAGAVVFISGATGPSSAAVNGPYDRTSETSGGYAVYSKRGDVSVCIEHRRGKWQLKLVSDKGTDACWASVAGLRLTRRRVEVVGWKLAAVR